MSDFQGQPRKKIALDNSKLGLVAKCPTAEGKISKLSWGLNKNNPFIRVYTGDPADESERTKNGRIQAELDAPHLYALMVLIRQATREENGWKNCISCSNYIFPGGKRSESPVVTAEIWVGKDKDGVVYISLIDKLIKDRPVIKFDICVGGFWIKLRHGDGREYTKAESSLVFANGYANMLEALYGGLLIDEFVPYQKPEGQNNGGRGGYGKGGGGGGGYSRGGNGGGGYSKGGDSSGGGSSSFGGDDGGDDIPF